MKIEIGKQYILNNGNIVNIAGLAPVAEGVVSIPIYATIDGKKWYAEDGRACHISKKLTPLLWMPTDGESIRCESRGLNPNKKFFHSVTVKYMRESRVKLSWMGKRMTVSFDSEYRDADQIGEALLSTWGLAAIGIADTGESCLLLYSGKDGDALEKVFAAKGKKGPVTF